jgi:hypothetical protein
MVLAAGCSTGSSNKSAAKQSAATTTAPAQPPTPVVVSSGGVQVLPGTATGNSPCEKAAPTASSPGQVGGGSGGSDTGATKADVLASEHGERGMIAQQPLTEADRGALEGQIETARQVAIKYPTVKEAEAAGYRKSTPFVPCIGAHYTNYALASSFNPAAPSELLYDGTEESSKIVGLSYLVWHHNGPPPGFAGTNDHWHQHNANGGLCLKGAVVVGDESTTNEQCAARGGRKALLIDIWMLHAWIVPGFECSWGTFGGECPELGGYLCGSAWSPPTPAEADKCRKGV